MVQLAARYEGNKKCSLTHPEGHTLPTDHAYIYHHLGNDPYPPINVYAPAGGRILFTADG